MERREIYTGSWCGNLKERIFPNTYPEDNVKVDLKRNGGYGLNSFGSG
jgi:hypothetical protein